MENLEMEPNQVPGPNGPDSSQSFSGSAYDSSLEATPQASTTGAFAGGGGIGSGFGKNNLSPFTFNKKAFMVTGASLAGIAVIGVTAFLFNNTSNNQQANKSNKSDGYSVGKLKVEKVPEASAQLTQAEHLAVNGQLQVGNTIIIAPTDAPKPSESTTGQIYYDKNTNTPYYYNGKTFVSLTTSINGATGPLTLGNGLSLNGNTISSVGAVSSVQGQTGAVSFTGGPGITINGATITNSGLLSVNSANPGQITVTQSGGSASLSIAGIQAGGVLVGTTNSAISTAMPTAPGQCLISDPLTSQPKFGNCSGHTSVHSLQVGVRTLDGALLMQGTGGLTLSSGSGAIFIDGSTISLPANFVGTLGTLTGLTTTGNSGQSSTPTLSVVYGNTATTSVEGNTTVVCPTTGVGSNLSGTNATITLGTGGSCGALSVASSPTFTGSLGVQGSGGITIGVAGSVTGIVTLANSASANLGILRTNALNQTTTYTLPDPGSASDQICLNFLGNCGGSGGVASPGGTTNAIAKFLGAQSIGDSAISDDGSQVTISENLIAGVIVVTDLQSAGALNITPGGNLTIGAGTQVLTLQGNGSSTLTITSGGRTNIVSFAPLSSNRTVTFPDDSGVVCLQGSSSCGFAGSGSGLQSITGTTSGSTTIATPASINNALTTSTSITIDNATTAIKGIASFNAGNFTSTSGAINTIQNIGTTATVTFGSLTIGTGDVNLSVGKAVKTDRVSPTASSGLTLDSGTNPSNNITFTTQNGTTSFTFPTTGGLGQVICTSGVTCASGSGTAALFEPASGVQNVTGSVTAIAINKAGGSGNLLQLQAGGSDIFVINASGQSTLDNLTLTGALSTNTISPVTALTMGATGQTFTLQGDSSSTIKGYDTGKFSALGFGRKAPNGAPTGNVSYLLENDSTVTPGTYFICTTAGNCNGVGGSVSGSGGVAGKIVLFTGPTTVTSSAVLSESGSTVTANGNLAVGVASTSNGTFILNNATNSNSTSLSLAAAPSSNVSILLPNASGTVAVSATGPLQLDATTGALSCPTCLASGGGGAGGVVSITGTTAGSVAANNTITINNALTTGSAITIDDASTTTKGIASFNSTNFTASSGAINLVQNIATTSSPTFSTLALQGSTGLTVGNTAGNTGTIRFLDGTNDGFTNTFTSATLTGNQTITVPDAGGSLVLGVTGTNLSLSGQGQASISNSPTFTTSVTTPLIQSAGGLIITPGGALTVGSTTQTLTLQGNTNAKITSGNGTFTSTLSFANPTANNAIVIPDGTGTICLSAPANNCGFAGSGSGLTSLDGIAGGLSIANATGVGSTITINDASTAQKGIASYNSSNFTVVAGVVNTKQNIDASAAPSFAGLTLSSLGTAGFVKNLAGGGFTTGSTLALGSDIGGNYVQSFNSGTGLTLGGTSGVGSVPTFTVQYGSAAGQAVQGNTSITCASGTGNLTGGGNSITLGVSGSSCNAIDLVANPTFTGAVSVQGSGGVTLGTTGAGGTVGKLVLGTSGVGNVTITSASQANAVAISVPTGVGAIDDFCLYTLANCTTTGGIGNFINNQYLTAQTSGNFNIQARATTVAAVIQGAASQNIINLYDSSNTLVANVNNAGKFTAVGVNAGNGLVTGIGGLTVTSAGSNDVKINENSNFATNINTGTSTGAVNIGNAAGGLISLNSLSGISFASPTSVTNGSLTIGTAGSTIGDLYFANTSSTRVVGVEALNPTGTGNVTLQIPTIAGGSSDTVCTVTLKNCTSVGGVSNYINNQTAQQTSANLNIQARAGTVAAVIQGSAGADIANFVSSGGTTALAISELGAQTYKTPTNSANAFTVQTSSGTTLFNVDTSASGVNIASAGLAGTIQIGNSSGSNNQDIKIGGNTNGSSSTPINIGSTSATSTMLIQSGTPGTLIKGATSGSAFQVQNAASTPLFTLDSTVGASQLILAANQFRNNGSTLYAACPITDLASGGSIGSAGTTVDVCTSFTLAQTTPGQTLTLPTPSLATAGRMVLLMNTGTATFTVNFTNGTIDVQPGYSQIFFWNGSVWGMGTPGGGSNVTLQGSYDGGNTVTTTNNRDLRFILADTTTDSNFRINVATNSTSKWEIQNNGTAMFRVNATGAVLAQNSTNSTSAFAVQNSGGSSIFNVDTTNTKTGFGSGNVTVAPPSTLTISSTSTSVTGGTLADNTTYYYKVSAVTPAGEITSSSEQSRTTGNSTSTAPATAPTAVSGLSCGGYAFWTYYYYATYTTASGETTAGPANAYGSQQSYTITPPNGGASVTSRKIYRYADGAGYWGNYWDYIGSVAGASGGTVTDSCVGLGASGVSPPGSNTTGNTNSITVNYNAITGATSYKIYRSTSSNTEALVGSTASTSYTDTGGATTTAYPTSTADARLGLGTTTPTTTLDARGSFLQKAQYNSTTAFQIQNAAGTNLVQLDTLNGKLYLDGKILSTANSLIFQNTSNSATALQVQNAAGTSILTVDTTNGKVLALGPATETSGTVKVGTYGSGGAFPEMCLNASQLVSSCSGSAYTLQATYNASSTPELTLDATRGALTIRDNASAIGTSLLEVQSNTGSSTYLAVAAANTTVGNRLILNGDGNGGTTYGAKFKNTNDSTTAFSVQNQGGDSLINMNTTNTKTAFGAGNTTLAGVTGPSITSGTTAISGGSLPGNTTYYYKVGAVTPAGEVTSGSEQMITTGPSQVTAPASAPGKTVNGTRSGGYNYTVYYVYTYTTATGETTASPSVSADYVNNWQISTTASGYAAVTGVKVYRLYQFCYGSCSDWWDYIGSAANGGTVNDTNVPLVGTSPPPSVNTATVSTNTTTINYGAVSGATSYNIYRSTSSGAETLLTSTAATSYTDTGSLTPGATAYPTSNSVTRLGVGTATPGYTMDVQGTFLAKNLYDSATAFQLQTTSGTNILNANTRNMTLTVTLNSVAYTLGTKSDYTVGSIPYYVAVADFNGDGRKDFITSDYGAGGVGTTVSLMMNNGSGTGFNRTAYAAGPGPLGITAADYNADGKQDFAFANYNACTGNTFTVYLNNGNGTFPASGTAGSAGACAYGITSGDVSGDGKPDIIVTNYNANTISVNINNGSGGFPTHTDYTTGTGPSSVATGDFNADGRLDIATSNYGAGNTVSVFLNQGSGTFPASGTSYTTSSGALNVSSADLNGDNKPDLVTSNVSGNNISVLLNSGTGTFPSKTDYPTGTSNYQSTLTDLNGDGYIDIATAGYGNSTLYRFMNNGSGLFTQATSLSTGTGPTGIASGDMNGDGIGDIVTANYGASSTSSVFLSQVASGSAVLSGKTALFANTADSTSSFRIQNTAASNLLTADTTNMRLSVGSIGTATGQLYVAGTLPASALISSNANAAATSVAIQGKYAYIATSNANGLYVNEVSNPQAPYNVSGSPFATQCAGSKTIKIHGKYLYVAGCGNFQAFDLSNPASPSSLGYINVAGGAGKSSLYIQGRYAYIGEAGTKTFSVVDIVSFSNVASPVTLTPGFSSTGVGAADIYVQGRYAYVANASAANGTLPFQVIDVSNPSSPSVAGSITQSALNTPISGAPSSVTVQGRYAYLGTAGFIYVIDVSNPASPSVVTSVNLSGGNANSITTQGRFLYASDATNAVVRVVDISNPASPSLISGTIATQTTGPNSISVSGRYLYAANASATGALQIFDLGGTYSQQVETGNTETDSISVRGNANLAQDSSVLGGLTVGTTAQFNGNFGASGQVLFKNNANTTNEFRIQNASGSNLFQVDTLNNNIVIGGNNSGALQPWASTTALTSGGQARRDHTTVTANGYIYVIGGTDTGGTIQTGVLRAKINADGTVASSWTSQAGGPTRTQAASVVANGYIYVIGGYDASTITNSVYYAKINADGSLGTWNTTTGINTSSTDRTIARHTSVVANGYVYVLGGYDGTSVVDTVYYAKLNADGTVGTWATTNAINVAGSQPRVDHSSVIANGYVYVIGGSDTNAYTVGHDHGEIYYAPLNLNGTIGSWVASSNPMPSTYRAEHASVVANGYLYILGGRKGATFFAEPLYASLPKTGGTGTWTQGTAPYNGIENTAVVNNGYIYMIGGQDVPILSYVSYTSTQRIKVGGALDLVGLGGANLSDPGGSYGSGSTGGELTAGNTNIVGALQVQGAANFAQNVAVGGNLNVAGDSLIGGTLTVTGAVTLSSTLNVTGNSTFTGTVTFNGKIISGGTTPTVTSTNANLGTGGTCTGTITGNPTSGKITIATGTGPATGQWCVFGLSAGYGAAPHIIISGRDTASAGLDPYAKATSSTSFDFGIGSTPAASTTYTFDYFIVQ